MNNKVISTQNLNQQINNLITHIPPIKYTEGDYERELIKKEQFDKQNAQYQEYILLVNDIGNKFIEGEQNGCCYICSEELSRKNIKYCGKCGQNICSKCVYRVRQISNKPSSFCQKCDRAILQSQINKAHLQSCKKYSEAFQRLVQQNKNLEMLIEWERNKIISKDNKEGQDLMKLIDHAKIIKQEIRAKQIDIQQIDHKIKWGKSITKDLKKKMYQLKLIHGGSFHSSFNDDEVDIEVEPPRAQTQSRISIDNINESLINSFWQQKTETVQANPIKCACIIY